MTTDELRNNFQLETNIKWENLDGEPNIDYVLWLEAKILTIHSITSISELRDTHDMEGTNGIYSLVSKRGILTLMDTSDNSYYAGEDHEAAIRAIKILTESHRPNIEEREDGLYACLNYHEKGYPCDYYKLINYPKNKK